MKLYIIVGAVVAIAGIGAVVASNTAGMTDIDKMITEKNCFALERLEREIAEGRDIPYEEQVKVTNFAIGCAFSLAFDVFDDSQGTEQEEQDIVAETTTTETTPSEPEPEPEPEAPPRPVTRVTGEGEISSISIDKLTYGPGETVIITTAIKDPVPGKLHLLVRSPPDDSGYRDVYLDESITIGTSSNEVVTEFVPEFYYEPILMTIDAQLSYDESRPVQIPLITIEKVESITADFSVDRQIYGINQPVLVTVQTDPPMYIPYSLHTCEGTFEPSYQGDGVFTVEFLAPVCNTEVVDGKEQRSFELVGTSPQVDQISKIVEVEDVTLIVQFDMENRKYFKSDEEMTLTIQTDPPREGIPLVLKYQDNRYGGYSDEIYITTDSLGQVTETIPIEDFRPGYYSHWVQLTERLISITGDYYLANDYEELHDFSVLACRHSRSYDPDRLNYWCVNSDGTRACTDRGECFDLEQPRP